MGYSWDEREFVEANFLNLLDIVLSICEMDRGGLGVVGRTE